MLIKTSAQELPNPVGEPPGWNRASPRYTRSLTLSTSRIHFPASDIALTGPFSPVRSSRRSGQDRSPGPVRPGPAQLDIWTRIRTEDAARPAHRTTALPPSGCDAGAWQRREEAFTSRRTQNTFYVSNILTKVTQQVRLDEESPECSPVNGDESRWSDSPARELKVPDWLLSEAGNVTLNVASTGPGMLRVRYYKLNKLKTICETPEPKLQLYISKV